MEFLVRIKVDLPPEMEAGERSRIREAELARGRELLASGAIESIWRIPGGIENVGVWEADDATALHALLESLPMFPWLTAEVIALARHPLNDQGDEPR
jgi:muconolactone D-isomerase